MAATDAAGWEHTEEAGHGRGEKGSLHPTVMYYTTATGFPRLKEWYMEKGVDLMYGSRLFFGGFALKILTPSFKLRISCPSVGWWNLQRTLDFFCNYLH